MTQKEEAKVLVESFENYVSQHDFFGDNIQFKMQKQCALIAVDEIIKKLKDISFNYDLNLDLEISWNEQVKTEIENL